MSPAVPFAGLNENSGIDFGRKDFAFGLLILESFVSFFGKTVSFIDYKKKCLQPFAINSNTQDGVDSLNSPLDSRFPSCAN
jgi:hypothetical protein